jgi:hypothetical protein
MWPKQPLWFFRDKRITRNVRPLVHYVRSDNFTLDDATHFTQMQWKSGATTTAAARTAARSLGSVFPPVFLGDIVEDGHIRNWIWVPFGLQFNFFEGDIQEVL